MKFFLLFAFVAVALAEPESDAQYVIPTVYAGPHHTAGLVHHLSSGAVVPEDTIAVKVAKAQHIAAKVSATTPYVYAAPVVPAVQYAKPVVQTVQYAKPVVQTVQTFPYTTYGRLFKREAEAEAEAKPEAEAKADSDPQYLYSNAYVTPYYNALPYYSGYASPYYSTYASYYNVPRVYNAYHHLYKREAEAEAKPEAKADSQYFYNNAYVTPYYNALPYYSGYASPYYSNYASYYNVPGVYNAYHHLYKREAEAEAKAEADPQFLYSNAYNAPSYYNAYAFPRYSTYATQYVYGNLPYSYNLPYQYGYSYGY